MNASMFGVPWWQMAELEKLQGIATEAHNLRTGYSRFDGEGGAPSHDQDGNPVDPKVLLLTFCFRERALNLSFRERDFRDLSCP